MVITAATPDVALGATSVNGVAPAIDERSRRALAPEGLYCRRCHTRMVMGYDEPQCLSCGYADYSYTRETAARKKRSIVSTATRSVLRYVGDFPTLTETLTYVKLVRVRNRVVYAVSCPFCNAAMDQSSLSGKRPEVREQRYKCMLGHRVSLIPTRNGMLGWR